jgi:tetratricopeptide (TPR) repeat protein
LKQQNNRHQSQSISSGKKNIFTIITLSLPILFLLLLELSLRQINYGPDLSLFTTEKVNGVLYYTLNPSVKSRYFSQVSFNPGPSPERFLVSKPSGTYRIFCLGGSTTVGYPYWYNGAFSSFLRDRLKTLFPHRNIEIVNVGMTATNSFTVLDMSKELVHYQPDLFIAYDGHNEFYGALGVASNVHGTTARWMTQLYLRLIHLRTFQLVSNIISSIRSIFGIVPIDYTKHTTLMEQVARGESVPYENETYKNGMSVFRQNLEDLINLCRKNNIPLIMSTQVSNIRDQTPFISNNSAEITEHQRSKFQQVYNTAIELQSKGNLDSAIVAFQSAISIDSLFAEAHYRLAQCLDRKGRGRDAYPEYIRARDYDELRFRTDSDFNNLIRSMDDHQHCFVADIENVFERLSPDSLIGHNLILEHLHPNVRGQFFIAKEYAWLMRQHSLLASTDEWPKQDSVYDEVLWKHRPLTNIDEMLAARKTELLTSAWPFRSKPLTIASPEVKDTLRFMVEQTMHNEIGWVTLHRRAAEYYQRRGDLNSAEMEFATIINQLPLDVSSYLSLAQLFYNQQQYPQAEKTFRMSLDIKQSPFAYRALGDIYMKQGKLDKAIESYTELTKFPEDAITSPENAYMLAFAYLFSGKTEQAIVILEKTINRYPGYKPAILLLAKAKLYEKSHVIK